jgi:MraZ protein
VLTAGPEKCIVAYSQTQWSKVAAALTGGTMPASKARRLNRALFSAAFSLNIDGQGRIALPVPLREYAGIGAEVIIAGANTYLELWNKEEWESEKATSQEQAWQIIESLERH